MKIRMQIKDGPKSFDFEHAGPSLAVGRNPAGELVLEEESPESVVSWEHARIDLSPREATLTDLRSTNGTYRNGTAVTGTVPLWPKDIIRFGQTGPTLTVNLIDLTPANGPKQRLIGAGLPTAIPVEPPMAKVVKTAKLPGGKVAAPVMSETRGIALQAVQNLMAQQEELRAHQKAQARHRWALTGIALLAILLFLLLGGGLLLHSGKLSSHGQQLGELASGQEKLQTDVSGLAVNMRQQAADTAEHFSRVEAEQAAEKGRQEATMAKVDAAAKQSIEHDAKIHGGLEKMKKDLGVSLTELNRRLAPEHARKTLTDATAATAPASAVADSTVNPRIEPGTKIDLITKNGVAKGVLLGIEKTRVRVQTLPYPDAKPTEYDVKDVQAFQTRDGIFAYNESTAQFEPAITYYRFNRSSHAFERTDNPASVYLSEDAKVVGPVNSAMALLAVGPGGEWTVGLPIPSSRSPVALEPYQLKEIVTAKGVYTYDQSKQDYAYKSYGDLAADAKAARDEYWRQVDEKYWQRRKESYQLVTDRLQALRPYFWWRWW
jgi:hypothetical protein